MRWAMRTSAAPGTRSDSSLVIRAISWAVCRSEPVIWKWIVIPHSRNCSWLDVGDKLHLRV